MVKKKEENIFQRAVS